MLQIKKNESNHIILAFENKKNEMMEMEITDTSCILCNADEQEVTYFKENIMEFQGNDNHYYIKRENGAVHVYDNQQVDIYIR